MPQKGTAENKSEKWVSDGSEEEEAPHQKVHILQRPHLSTFSNTWFRTSAQVWFPNNVFHASELVRLGPDLLPFCKTQDLMFQKVRVNRLSENLMRINGIHM